MRLYPHSEILHSRSRKKRGNASDCVAEALSFSFLLFQEQRVCSCGTRVVRFWGEWQFVARKFAATYGEFDLRQMSAKSA